MPRLTWGAAGERLFEIGVDRGVLYVQDGSGVVWNGLVSVSENPSGGEPKEYYLDGVKYLNLASTEEFRASLEAYTYPDEFGEYDGTTPIKNGLFLTRQARRSFGLSYRTRLGNADDPQMANYSYKIHIVYNALALPSPRVSNTLSGDPEPSLFRWELTTQAPFVSGYSPTSHFVIDSRHTPIGLLEKVENILYGGMTSYARLPSVEELIDIFNNYTPPVDVAPLKVDGGPPSRITTMVYDGGSVTSQFTSTIDGGTI